MKTYLLKNSFIRRILVICLIQALLPGNLLLAAPLVTKTGCLSPVLQIESGLLHEAFSAGYYKSAELGSERQKLGMFTFGASAKVKFEINAEGTRLISKEETVITDAFNRAFNSLAPKEQQIIQSALEKNKHDAEEKAFALPLILDPRMKEACVISADQVTLNEDVLSAPRNILSLVFLQAFRKYIFTSDPEYFLTLDSNEVTKSLEKFSVNSPLLRNAWARWKQNAALHAFCLPYSPGYFSSLQSLKYINETWAQRFNPFQADTFYLKLAGFPLNSLLANEHLADFIEYVRRIMRLPQGETPISRINVGHERILAFAKQVKKDEYYLMFSHQGSPMAAEINFLPDNRYQDHNNGLGEFGPGQDQDVYEILEVFNSEIPGISKNNPGNRMLVTGKSLRIFGLSFDHALPILSTKIYRFRKIAEKIPSPNTRDYQDLLAYSLLNYKRLSPQDRLKNSFVSSQIIDSLYAGKTEFFGLFHLLTKLIGEDKELEVNELSRVFSDIFFYGDQQTKDKVQNYLIDLAINEENDFGGRAEASYGLKTDDLSEISAMASENAIKILRSSSVGEIVLSSPESLWSGGTGGMALYVTDLARELAIMGIPVTVVVPLFNEEPRKTKIFVDYGLRDTGRAISIKFGRRGQETAPAKIYETNVNGVNILYLENPVYFGKLKGGRGEESAYNGTDKFRMRFSRMLSLGTLLAIRKMNIHAQVIQTNDWATAYLKAYLEGRERIDPELSELSLDPHLIRTKVLSITHNSHRYYQGIAYNRNESQRDDIIYEDLGFAPEYDIDILVQGFDYSAYRDVPEITDRAWFDINPTYTAIRTADHLRDVSKGHHDRSIDKNFELEFGFLSGVLSWKNSIGDYDGQSNGFGLSERQRDFLKKMISGPAPLPDSLKRLNDFLEQGVKEKSAKLNEGAAYKKFLDNFYDNPGFFLRGFYGIMSPENKKYFDRFLVQLKPKDKTKQEFEGELETVLESRLLKKTTKVLRSRMKSALADYRGVPEDADFAELLGNLLDRPGKTIKSFFDMGHENERQLYARFFFYFIKPLQKDILQNVFGLNPGNKKFIYSMLHRVGEQKGHQLMAAQIWDIDNPDILQAKPGTVFYDSIEDHEFSAQLSKKDKNKLIKFAEDNNCKSLSALEVAMILNPDAQFVIVGSSEGNFDKVFREIYERFKPYRQFAYLPVFISINSALYDLIYSGSDRFGMPSWYEPGGLSNQEASGYGTVRHLTRRDGLVDGELQEGSFRESFLNFNPVAWFESFSEHARFYRESPESERKLMYKAITQDNRWLNRAKNYIELYRKLAGSRPIPELRALEMTEAIHRAMILKQDDPADELMKAGFTSRETMDELLKVVMSNSNDDLVHVLIEKYIPYLSKIPELRTELIERIKQRLDNLQKDSLIRGEFYDLKHLLKNINSIAEKHPKTKDALTGEKMPLEPGLEQDFFSGKFAERVLQESI